MASSRHTNSSTLKKPGTFESAEEGSTWVEWTTGGIAWGAAGHGPKSFGFVRGHGGTRDVPALTVCLRPTALRGWSPGRS